MHHVVIAFRQSTMDWKMVPSVSSGASLFHSVVGMYSPSYSFSIKLSMFSSFSSSSVSSNLPRLMGSRIFIIHFLLTGYIYQFRVHHLVFIIICRHFLVRFCI